MEKLLDGIVKFRQKDFEAHKALFQSLGGEQKPHTLFIACSDSRVDPNWITKTKPGELFIIRNIANIVPPYRLTEEFLATTSAIEYAVQVLGVENIIVCGHSNCGGCAACLKEPEMMRELPHTRRWLELSGPVREQVLREIPASQPEAREWMMEQANAVAQLKHLASFPYIKEKVQSGSLKISAWYYIIETGEVYIYDPDQDAFVLANG